MNEQMVLYYTVLRLFFVVSGALHPSDPLHELDLLLLELTSLLNPKSDIFKTILSLGCLGRVSQRSNKLLGFRSRCTVDDKIKITRIQESSGLLTHWRDEYLKFCTDFVCVCVCVNQPVAILLTNF